MANVLTSRLGGLFIQKTTHGHPEWLNCGDLDTVTEPTGDISLIQCLNADGNYVSVGSTQAPPGNGTFSVKAKMFPDADVLDDLNNCDVNVYALSRDCGRKDDFTGWKRALAMRARVTSRADEGLVLSGEDKETTRTLEFTFARMYRARAPLAIARQTIAEVYAINDIAFCNQFSCGDQCGNPKELGTDGFIAVDLVAASPATQPKAWVTDDAGVNWAQTSGNVFGFIGDAGAAECFKLNSTTTRWVLARKGVVGEGFEIAYSDDEGTTWTNVQVSTTAGEGVNGAGGLFALDKDHIWAITSAGKVYFSSDSAASWSEQTSAVTADSAASMYAIHFADADNGYAVGASDAIIHTTDGETWTAITSPTTGSTLRSLFVFSKSDFIFGTAQGELYTSVDEGDTFTAQIFSGQVSTSVVNAISFANLNCGFMVVNTSAPVGAVHRTIDGGHTWEVLTTPTNTGLNAVTAIDTNTAFVVGEAQGGTGFVAKVSAS